MIRKLLYILILSLTASLSALAQELVVKSISEKASDLTARTHPRRDANNELCAAIIVAAPSLEGIVFSGNIVGNVQYEAGTYEMYVPAGTKKISYRHDSYLPGTIDFASSGVAIEQGVTYLVILQKSADEVLQSQFLVFNLTPSDALIELEGEMLNVSNGVAMKLVKLGTYRYKALASGYKTLEGTVTVSDPKAKTMVNVALTASVGKVVIGRNENISIDGATVFFDGEMMDSKAPLTIDNVAAGRHTIRLMKPMYNSVEQAIMVSEGKVTIYNPQLKSNAARVRISTPAGTTIRVNGEEKGTSLWVGTLTAGVYLFEAVRDGAVVCAESHELAASEEQKSIELKEETGSLVITSSVLDAKVLLDGSEVGGAPLFLDNVAPGEHRITLSSEGYLDYNLVVFVEANQNTNVNAEMQQGKIVQENAADMAQTPDSSYDMNLMVAELKQGIDESVRDRIAYVSPSEVRMLLNVAFYRIPDAKTLEEIDAIEELLSYVEKYNKVFNEYTLTSYIAQARSKIKRSKGSEMSRIRKEEEEKQRSAAREELELQALSDPGSFIGNAVSIRNKIQAQLRGDNMGVTSQDVLKLLKIVQACLGSITSRGEYDFFSEMVALADQYNSDYSYSSDVEELSMSISRDLHYLKRKIDSK